MNKLTPSIYPSQLELERAVVAHALMNREYSECGIQPQHFTLKSLTLIWSALEAVVANLRSDEHPDLFAVAAELETHQKLAEAGGMQLLTALSTSDIAWLPLSPATAARRLEELHHRRLLAQEASALATAESISDLNAKGQAVQDRVQAIEFVSRGAGPEPVGNYNEVQATLEPISWVWRPWLPQAMLTMVVGLGGIGKSQLLLHLAGCVCLGRDWLDDQPPSPFLGDALWVDTEASQAMTIDRCNRWGIELACLSTPRQDVFWEPHLELPEDLAIIERALRRESCRLAIIDSLSGGHSRDENAATILGIGKALALMARNAGKPLVIAHHLRKRSVLDSVDEITLDRVRGSTALCQMARVIWAIDRPDPDDPALRLYQIKNNLAPLPSMLGFLIGSDGLAPTTAPTPQARETVGHDAVEFLEELLARGQQPVSVIYKAAASEGISERSLRRAKGRLRIVKLREGKQWFWGLRHAGEATMPEDDATVHEEEEDDE